MTSTSGPGISLMAEYAGLAHFAEIPVVIWNVQRAGPSTGLPTRTAQCDLTFTYFLGHGDTKHVILLPGSINECFEFGWKSFDIAERLQTIIFVLSDLDFGMNQWIASPFEYPDTPMDRGKVLWEEDIEKLKSNWGRYRDVDGDGIPYRTIPGNRHPGSAFFTRGTGHTEEARYSEDAEVYENLLARLSKKHETAREILPSPMIDSRASAKIGIIAFGSSDAAVQEARFHLDQEGFTTDYMRIRAIPFSSDVQEFIAQHKRNYVVELNRDGQMHQLLTLDFPEHATKLIPTQHLDGMPLTAKQVLTKIKTKEANYS